MGTPFFKQPNDIRFECTRCGNCCTRPGPVYFPDEDLRRAAAYLKMSPTRFRMKYVAYEDEGVPAVDPGPELPCSFFDPDSGCTIYEARPTQCRTFPFWPEIVNRKRSWDRAAKDCEGMNRGPRVSLLQIETALRACDDVGLPEGDPW